MSEQEYDSVTVHIAFHKEWGLGLILRQRIGRAEVIFDGSDTWPHFGKPIWLGKEKLIIRNVTTQVPKGHKIVPKAPVLTPELAKAFGVDWPSIDFADGEVNDT